jgi:hypothetical protein
MAVAVAQFLSVQYIPAPRRADHQPILDSVATQPWEQQCGAPAGDSAARKTHPHWRGGGESDKIILDLPHGVLPFAAPQAWRGPQELPDALLSASADFKFDSSLDDHSRSARLSRLQCAVWPGEWWPNSGENDA